MLEDPRRVGVPLQRRDDGEVQGDHGGRTEAIGDGLGEHGPRGGAREELLEAHDDEPVGFVLVCLVVWLFGCLGGDEMGVERGNAAIR